MNIVDTSKSLSFVIGETTSHSTRLPKNSNQVAGYPALRQAQDKLAFDQARIQFNQNAGFRVMPGMTALMSILLFIALWLPHSAYAEKNILVFGDSLSAGYGIAVEESWPSLLQQELKRTHSRFSIVNASISGETALGGRQRIAKALQQHRPAIVILELGVNDGLRGFSTADIEANLSEIIGQANHSGAEVLLVGMRLPPNYGEPYVTQFGKVYPKLAEKYRVRLLPFLLEGVAPQQFQADNLHPAQEAQPQIMQKVLKELKPLLR